MLWRRAAPEGSGRRHDRSLQRYDIICVCHAALSTPVRIARPRGAADLHITAPDGLAAYPYIVARRTPGELHFISFDNGFEIHRRAVYHIVPLAYSTNSFFSACSGQDTSRFVSLCTFDDSISVSRRTEGSLGLGR